jgi:two-component system, sensor histidine kinase and response regulator
MKHIQSILLSPFKSMLLRNPAIADLDKKVFQKIRETIIQARNSLLHLIASIKKIGTHPNMDEYEKRKLGIFNQLNFLQLVTGLIVPLSVIATDKNLSSTACFESLLPCFVSVLVLALNHSRRFESALLCYFILYPVITSVIYMGGMNLGVELFFILYGILSVFFIHQIGQMLFAVSLSMISYFVLSVLWKNYYYELEKTHIWFYLFNQLLAVAFIFYALYLIKKENADYQFKILQKSRMLNYKNLEIKKQKKEIETKAGLLEKQTGQLKDSDAVKNKLFSVIAHDLKTPMFALRNLFQNIQDKNVKPHEIREMMPEVIKDLNYTTELIENLLHWARNQMRADTIHKHSLNISKIADDVLQLMRLQTTAKNIDVENRLQDPIIIFADSDMVHLVLRNLVSNAIKFTPPKGRITIGSNEMAGYVEIFIRDTGVGMSPDGLQKIRQNIFFTTKGTINESGTGLGLMLCKEFISKNGGHMYVESEQGKGTTISFTLPRGGELLKAV